VLGKAPQTCCTAQSLHACCMLCCCLNGIRMCCCCLGLQTHKGRDMAVKKVHKIFKAYVTASSMGRCSCFTLLVQL
jgi:hypothetical protein